MCFLGALDTKDLGAETLESMDEVDMLFVPISGEGVLDSVNAYKLGVSLEAKAIIPMQFSDTSDKNLKNFLKEAGAEKAEAQDKLTVKRKDLDGKQGEVMVLAPVN